MVMKIGILGTGNIAPAYIKGCTPFPQDIQITACADMLPEKAQDFARVYGLQVQSIDDLLANDELELVINLTIPATHARVSQQIIAAHKHVYSEKPLALTREEGQQILAAAREKGVRVGCAPDTFLGAGGQTCRRLIDSGVIGEPIATVAFMANHGHESWHPNPSFYYQPGGGPMLDMGPYYLTALVNLLGPITSVSAMSKRSFAQRIAQHANVKGQVISVDVDTHIGGTIQFASGVITTLVMSFDVWTHHLPCIEIYGTEGTLVVPDPNQFAGMITVWDTRKREWREEALMSRGDMQRGVGVADMARAIRRGEAHRASGDLAYHVLDAMAAFEDSARQKQHIALTSTIERPQPFLF